jgi:excisionase family DNA binding protein
MSEAPNLLTIAEVARILRCSTKTVHRQIRRGHLLATKPKGQRLWLVSEQSVKDLLNTGVAYGK